MEATKKKSSKSKPLAIKKVKELVTMFKQFSQKNIQAGNLGMAKHFLVQACYIALENREMCNAGDKAQRESMAQQLINQAKVLKGQINKQVMKVRSIGQTYEKAFNATYVDAGSIKVKFEDVIGQEKAKQAISEALIYPSKRPDFFEGLRTPPRGKF